MNLLILHCPYLGEATLRPHATGESINCGSISPCRDFPTWQCKCTSPPRNCYPRLFSLCRKSDNLLKKNPSVSMPAPWAGRVVRQAGDFTHNLAAVRCWKYMPLKLSTLGPSLPHLVPTLGVMWNLFQNKGAITVLYWEVFKLWRRGYKAFPIKDHIVNVSGFACCTVFAPTIQFYQLHWESNQLYVMNGHGCIAIKLYLKKK